ncbi:MAG: TetR/AcrR family transcriptional regulator [Desulfobacterales bacterium]|nr:TetR/AcrR family transcriptional regulator [Desulfobacterales bacterium]
MTKLSDIPLRERKQSRTRLAIYDASQALLKDRYLSEIKVEEICEMVEISRGTFFKYFTRKVDLITYAIRLWSVETGWEVEQMDPGDLGITFIYDLFHRAAENMKINPYFWREMMALKIFEPETINRLNQNQVTLISLADRLMRFPDKPGIEDIPEGTILTFLKKSLKTAVEKEELPGNLDIDSTLISLTSILYGVPMMMSGYTDLTHLPDEYDRQLNILWTGLRSVLSHPPDKNPGFFFPF